jgi:alkanesulfonate monooxygenase SsuD/methylene tetrahydromethanopterin reductase-like flavin-dependent oxidoreductase (luciferase family)
MPSFRVLKLSGKTSKKFAEPKERASVNRMVVAPETEEEAHNRQDAGGRLAKEEVPIQPLRERWHRRFVRRLRDAVEGGD